MTLDPVRWLWAALSLALYAIVCWRCLRRRTAAPPQAEWLVAYASQTGTAEALARHTVSLLATAGHTAQAVPLGQVDADTLRGAPQILFVVATFGEGDAPDAAAPFVRTVLGSQPDLSGLRYAVLGLGDSSYARFCGFARSLDEWLASRGARALFERLEADRVDPAAIEHWQELVCRLSGAAPAQAWVAAPFQPWVLAERTVLNPGSLGAPVYRLRLRPQNGELPAWESGDLAQVAVPSDPGRPRDYSIASVPAEGRVELLVRLYRRPGGGTGAASSWLCEGLAEGDVVPLRMHRHERFHLGPNAGRPLICIGNGTGIAGLRAHLKSRIDQGEYRNWLVFGERQAAHDQHYGAEIAAWIKQGKLARCDAVFSRDQEERRYVQHALKAAGVELAQWVEQGAAIYVCGSLRTMAADVDAALEAILGRPALDALAAQGRYRRDVY